MTGKLSHWGDLEARWTTLTYRRTAIHGLSVTEAALIMKKTCGYRYKEYQTRERPDGLVDLFHIKLIRKTIKTEIVEMKR